MPDTAYGIYTTSDNTNAPNVSNNVIKCLNADANSKYGIVAVSNSIIANNQIENFIRGVDTVNNGAGNPENISITGNRIRLRDDVAAIGINMADNDYSLAVGNMVHGCDDAGSTGINCNGADNCCVTGNMCPGADNDFVAGATNTGAGVNGAMTLNYNWRNA